MDATVAKRRYVLLVIELVPSFKMPTDEPRTDAPASDAAPQVSESVASVERSSDATPVQSPQQPLQQQVQRRAAPAPRLVSRAQQTSAPPLSATARAAIARRKQPVPALSYAMIALQIIALVALAAALLFASMRYALPLARDVMAQHEDALASSRAVAKSLTPLFWFALGYVFVAAIRSRVRVHCVWVSVAMRDNAFGTHTRACVFVRADLLVASADWRVRVAQPRGATHAQWSPHAAPSSSSRCRASTDANCSLTREVWLGADRRRIERRQQQRLCSAVRAAAAA